MLDDDPFPVTRAVIDNLNSSYDTSWDLETIRDRN